MAPKLPYPNYLTKHYYIIYIYQFKVNIKRRKYNPKFIKVKRKGITVQKYFAELFPNLYTWEDKRSTPKPTYIYIYIPIRKVNKKRRKYNPNFIKAIQEKANYKTWDEKNIIYRWVV